MDFDYIVADPTGNITVLITSPYTPENRQDMIQEAFEREPSCEQVGFLMSDSDADTGLEMMGYEFCGNATLSAAAWHAGTHGLEPGCDAVITVESSGADEILNVHVRRLEKDSEAASDVLFGGSYFEGTVGMPVPALSAYRGYPLISFEGISHLLVPADDFSIPHAEKAVQEYARELEVSALGLMLCPDYDALTSTQPDEDSVSIRPLVYVPDQETLFWEHGCATGSTAAGWYRYMTGGSSHTEIKQPGGIIRVDVTGGQPMLTGKVIFRSGR